MHLSTCTCSYYWPIYWLTGTQHQFAYRIDTPTYFTIIKTLASMNAVMWRNRLLINCFNRRLFVWLFHKSMYAQCSQVVYHDIVTSLSNTRVHRIVCLYPWLTSLLVSLAHMITSLGSSLHSLESVQVDFGFRVFFFICLALHNIAMYKKCSYT